jgi:hypothetical protein
MGMASEVNPGNIDEFLIHASFQQGSNPLFLPRYSGSRRGHAATPTVPMSRIGG